MCIIINRCFFPECIVRLLRFTSCQTLEIYPLHFSILCTTLLIFLHTRHTISSICGSWSDSHFHVVINFNFFPSTCLSFLLFFSLLIHLHTCTGNRHLKNCTFPLHHLPIYVRLIQQFP